MNVAFYVSGRAERLRKILGQSDERLISSTKLIFSDDKRNLYLKTVAEELGILYHCLDYDGIRASSGKSKGSIMSDELLELMEGRSIDYCFSFGDHLLSGKLLSRYENRFINFHPSVLPMFPGLLAIDQAVDARSNLLGSTAHFINAGIDAGPIIMQNVVSSRVFAGCDYEKILDQQIPMLYQIFKWLEAGRLEVEGDAVTVKDADYQQSAFFPAIEVDS